MWKKLFSRWRKPAEPISVVPKPSRNNGLSRAVYKAQETESAVAVYKLPTIHPGVIPAGAKAGVAMDSNIQHFQASQFYGFRAHFLGYPYLSELATRSEYRAMSSALSTELTREWITLNSSETAGESTKNKITEIAAKLKEIRLQQVIQQAAEHDALYGRGQIFIDIKNAERTLPLILDSRTIAKDSFVGVKTVEAIWTTPSAYNAIDPSAPDFYRPSAWYMLGQQIHASRLLTVITRPVPDMLKPSFNFGGMSLSQLAEPYVNKWLRTQQSVADLVNNFSVTALKTDMSQVLSGGGGEECGPESDGTNLFARAKLFTEGRSNKGLMLLDYEREDLVKVDTSLAGLHELQAQALEHLCFPSRMPAVVLTGLSPSGLNVSTEGEMSTWRDWIAAQQEAFWRSPIETIIKVLQLSMYGEIDPDITFVFNPLFQLTEKELAELRKADAERAATYLDRGVIAPEEERERIARDPDSGYQGLDLSVEIEVPGENDDENEDEEVTSGSASSKR